MFNNILICGSFTANDAKVSPLPESSGLSIQVRVLFEAYKKFMHFSTKKVMSNNNNSDDYSGEVKKGSSSSSSHLGGGVQQDLKPHLAAIQQGNVPQGGSAGLTTDSIYFGLHFV